MMGYATWRGIKSRSSSSSDRGHVTVGSKDFTESNVLAEIVAQMLGARGIEVTRQFDLGGNLAHGALVAGQIDLYPEYTGTSFTAILHHQPITDPKAVYDQVKTEYLQQFNVEVSPPLGFDNTFAILVRGEDARRLNLKTISDAARHSRQWQAGFGHDFMVRQDGYPGFSRAYGLQFRAVSDMALDLLHCVGFAQIRHDRGKHTDGECSWICPARDDRVTSTLRRVFLTRADALKREPELASVLQKLAGALSTDEMRKLNYEVDGAKRDKKVVVREWLLRRGFIK